MDKNFADQFQRLLADAQHTEGTVTVLDLEGAAGAQLRVGALLADMDFELAEQVMVNHLNNANQKVVVIDSLSVYLNEMARGLGELCTAIQGFGDAVKAPHCEPDCARGTPLHKHRNRPVQPNPRSYKR